MHSLYPEETFLSNYADDNTTLESLKIGFIFLVLHVNKYYYTCFVTGSENDDFIFDGIKLPNNCKEEIACVTIDNGLKFDPQIRKSRAKLGLLNRISSLLDPEKKNFLKTSENSNK